MNNYRNILLIEDDPAVAHSLIDGLTQANFEVTWKENGRDGITHARERHPHYKVFDTICEANRNRQEELKNLCHLVDAIIVVGGKGSANTNRLAEIAKSKGAPTYFLENEAELNLEELKHYKQVGVIGGASTPEWVLQGVFDKLESVGANEG